MQDRAPDRRDASGHFGAKSPGEPCRHAHGREHADRPQRKGGRPARLSAIPPREYAVYRVAGPRAAFVNRTLKEQVNRGNPASDSAAIIERRRKYRNISSGLTHDWSEHEVLPFADEGKELDHITRHGLNEMRFQSAEQYIQAATDFMPAPLDKFTE